MRQFKELCLPLTALCTKLLYTIVLHSALNDIKIQIEKVIRQSYNNVMFHAIIV